MCVISAAWTHETISPQKSHSRDWHESSNTAETLKNQQNMKTHTHTVDLQSCWWMRSHCSRLFVVCFWRLTFPSFLYRSSSLVCPRLFLSSISCFLFFFQTKNLLSVVYLIFFFAFRKCHWRPSRHTQSKNTTGPSLSDTHHTWNTLRCKNRKLMTVLCLQLQVSVSFINVDVKLLPVCVSLSEKH